MNVMELNLPVTKASEDNHPPFDTLILVIERDVQNTALLRPESDKGYRYTHFFGRMHSISAHTYNFTTPIGETRNALKHLVWFAEIDVNQIEETLDSWGKKLDEESN